jgi:hypothetical protein
VATFEKVLAGALVLYAIGVALDMWRRPLTWERTFATCAIAATPAFIIEEIIASSARAQRCTTVHISCFDYYYVHSPLLVGAIVFLFLLGGAVTGRWIRLGTPF